VRAEGLLDEAGASVSAGIAGSVEPICRVNEAYVLSTRVMG
jgi:hypothetical protein